MTDFKTLEQRMEELAAEKAVSAQEAADLAHRVSVRTREHYASFNAVISKSTLRYRPDVSMDNSNKIRIIFGDEEMLIETKDVNSYMILSSNFYSSPKKVDQDAMLSAVAKFIRPEI